jgi:hypothetical protein
MSTLCTAHDSSAHGTWRGAGGGGRRLAGRRQGAYMARPWVTGHKPDKVLILSSPRGGRTTVKQKLTGAVTAQQLSDGEGATPTARGGPPGQGGAP